MRTPGRFASVFTWLFAASTATLAPAAEPAQPKSSVAADVRLQPLKDLNGYFPFTPPKSADEWQARREAVRRQILVAEGLWPMPTKTPLNAVVHGRVERDDFTVDRVILETYPGHFLCGSLFKPKVLKDKNPAVLSPHGHGKDGRFENKSREMVRGLIVNGAERFEQGGRSIYQSRCVQLARMGCIAFLYDMEGYADTTQLSFELVHRYGEKRPQMETPENWGFYSPQAESRLQSVMGLQTWNNIRALDFILSLPEVDSTRVGVTGESGGGTQTMLLAAIDDRIAASMPAVMVSTAMQGGCTCENCTVLRVDTGNIEFAALFAPKPQGLLAADDWTKEIMTKGFPELKELYALLKAPKNIEAYPFVHFPHNYNHVSRSAMYGFFNRNFKLGLETPVVEEDYVPLTREELTVWTGEHPQPPGGDEHERKLVRYMTEDSDKQIAALKPTDAESLKEYRRVVGGGIDAIVGRRVADVGEVAQENLEETDKGDYLFYRCRLSVPKHGEVVHATYFYPKQWNNQVVVWLHNEGAKGLNYADGETRKEVIELVQAGYAVAGVDWLGQGPNRPEDFMPYGNRRVKNERLFAGYTYGYNHPLLIQRVHDVLTVVAHAQANHHTPEKIYLVGFGEAGGITALAAAQSGDAVAGLAVDFSEIRCITKTQPADPTPAVETNGNSVSVFKGLSITHALTACKFRFALLDDYLDGAFVPGLVKYGDVPGIVALSAPRRLWFDGEAVPDVVQAAYAAAGTKDAITSAPDGGDVVKWLKGE